MATIEGDFLAKHFFPHQEEFNMFSTQTLESVQTIEFTEEEEKGKGKEDPKT